VVLFCCFMLSCIVVYVQIPNSKFEDKYCYNCSNNHKQLKGRLLQIEMKFRFVLHSLQRTSLFLLLSKLPVDLY